jgi:TPR repeat protein
VIAIVMYDQAADLNFPPAIFNLGVMYMEGKGTPRGMPSIHTDTLLSESRDMAKAREYFQRAERLNPKLRMPEVSDLPVRAGPLWTCSVDVAMSLFCST